MIINTKSYPRAAVIGNPSDGYFGKTIAFVFQNFCAEVDLWGSEKFAIIPNQRDLTVFENLIDFNAQIQNFGYYGGIRLLKATIRKFSQFCLNEKIQLPNKNFSLKYQSNIPNRLGLAGSSAIITAALKAIFQFYNIEISKAAFANLVLSVETEELGISAGLQDRVAQTFEQPIFMNFDKRIMEKQGFGDYQTFDKILLPNFYIAYRQDLSEGSEVVHNNLRERFDRGEENVVFAMKKFADLTIQFFEILQGFSRPQPLKGSIQTEAPSGKYSPLGVGGAKNLAELMDQNFDLRRSICTIDSNNLEMINLARNCGASAKFTGSGGAIIGIYENEKMYENLSRIFEEKGISILKPEILNNSK